MKFNKGNVKEILPWIFILGYGLPSLVFENPNPLEWRESKFKLDHQRARSGPYHQELADSIYNRINTFDGSSYLSLTDLTYLDKKTNLGIHRITIGRKEINDPIKIFDQFQVRELEKALKKLN